MNKVEALCKLIALEPIEPLHAKYVCGWSEQEFNEAVKAAIAEGVVRMARSGNNRNTRLEMA